MPRSARPEATAAMNACVMPAPAPWANTKPARACCGRVSSAETAPALPTSILSGSASFIASCRFGGPEIFEHLAQRRHDLAPALAEGPELSFQRQLGKTVHRGPGHRGGDLRLFRRHAGRMRRQFLHDNLELAMRRLDRLTQTLVVGEQPLV